MAPTLRRLKIAVSGLGRMGARHAQHFLHRTPKAELVAAFTPADSELVWAKENLEPWGVKIYSDYDEMLKHEGLEAVCVAVVTTAHAEQSIKAIEAGLHVLCEKPLSTKLDVCQQLLDVAASHPKQKVMCGFSRRFDASYLSAYAQTVNGSIGRPTILRSQTCDKYDPSGFFVDAESKILPKVKSVIAFGVTAVEPDLAKHGDVDNGVGVVEFYDGQIAYFYSSRMNPPGQHDTTEIIGTKGKLSVNANPTTGLLESHLSTGIHRDIPQNYYERFEHAFVEEARQFTDAVLENKEVPVDLTSSMEAVKIGVALQDSLKSGRKIAFGRDGKRVDEDGQAKARL
ncbi:hypothetical protein HBI80_067780 [Parastagonospora nodorum]|nr:hypothetical protein HBI80_067780 [Parastagonospora nodorum]